MHKNVIKFQNLNWMKIYFKLFTILILTMLINNVNAQEPTFTQFYANPIYLNPAFAGSNKCPRINMNYRNEWPNLSGNYVTYSASYDKFVKSIAGGIGLLATYDQQGKGTINTAMLGLTYSYHLKVNRKFSMLFGARAAYFQKSIDPSKLTFNDMIDRYKGFIYPTNDKIGGSNTNNVQFFNASAGVLGYSKRFFAGFAVHNINMPNESLIQNGVSPQKMRFTVHAGADIKINGSKSRYSKTTSLMPNIIFQYQQGFMEMNLGTYVKHGSFTFGVWYRNRDAFILSLGLSTKAFRIGYSYDVTVSKLNNGVSYGSHEVSMALNLSCGEKPVNRRSLSCPSF
jgi:type IX secretion system PorP/SprF family membrane protein